MDYNERYNNNNTTKRDNSNNDNSGDVDGNCNDLFDIDLDNLICRGVVQNQ